MDYVIQKGDTPSKLAIRFTGKEGRWPELCKANPQLQKHASYGCVFYVGKTIKIPDSWVQTVADPTTGQPVVIPVSQQAPAATATGPVVATEAGPATAQQVEASSSMGKVVLIGAAGVAALVVVVYAMKRKAAA